MADGTERYKNTSEHSFKVACKISYYFVIRAYPKLDAYIDG